MDCHFLLQGIFPTQESNLGVPCCRQMLYQLSHQGSLIYGNLPQKIPGMYCHSPCPPTCSRPPPTHAFARDFWTPAGKSAVGSLFLSPGSWCTRFCCALQESISQSYVSSGSSMLGVKGNLFQEGLCHTQVCSTQSLCPCGSPLLTCFSTGDAQTQFCLSLCGVPGSWCSQDLFEPSEHLWQEWGLILNMNLPLLPSCWGFSFALGCGVSPHSHSSAYRLTGVSLTLDMGYHLSATGHSSATQPPLQR